jgi:hypothetical protein
LDIRCFIKEEVISNLTKTKENIMDFLKKISSWANQLVEVGTTLIALGVVFEVLFKGMNIPFWPNISVVDNIMGIISGLSAEGLVGLVGAFVLYHILKNKG